MANFNKNSKQSVSKNWIKVTSKTYPDRVYFYNVKTKSSSWTNPCEESDKYKTKVEANIEKNSEPTLLSPVMRKKKKKKKEKSNVAPTISLPSMINNNIEDYDDHQEQYFESALTKSINPNQKKNKIKSNLVKSLDETNKTFKLLPQKNFSKNSKCDLHNMKQDFPTLEKEEKEILSKKRKKTLTDNSAIPKPLIATDICKVNNKNDVVESYKETSNKNEKPVREKISFKIEKTPAQTHLLKFKETLPKIKVVNSKEVLKKYSSKGKVPSYTEPVKASLIKGKTPSQARLLKLKKDLESLHNTTGSGNVFLKNCLPVTNEKSPLIPKVLNKKNNFLKEERVSLLETELNKVRSQTAAEKTPAQAQLMKFRKKLTQKIDETTCSWPKTFANEVPQHVMESFALEANKNCSDNNLDFVEEMDWDPIDEELDAKLINEVCHQMDICKEIMPDAIDNMNSVNSFSALANAWILVPDTNIFVTDLNFIDEINNTIVPDLGYPIVYVPWRVLQELDYLKDSKIDSQKKRLSLNARRSISYINENFKSKQSRFCGQGFEDFMNMVNTKVSNPDDEILETCLKLQKQYTDKKVVLLTNDKNLESKAIISNLEAYNKDTFKKKFLTPRTNCEEKNIESVQNNIIECDIKISMKDFISQIVENEMEKAFGKDWIKICHRKPPWALQDALKCLIMHWRSVFFVLFSKDVFSNAEKLYKLLCNNKIEFAQNTSYIVEVSKELLKSLKIVPKSYLPYQKRGDAILEKLLNLEKSNLEDMNFGKLNQDKLTSNFDLKQLHNSENNSSDIRTQAQTENFGDDFFFIKVLLSNIWESLKNFCIEVSEWKQSGDPNNSHKASEILPKLHDAYTKVSGLTYLLNLILKANSDNISENNSLIIQLHEYLINLFCSVLPEEQRKLKKALVIFCSNLEGRSMLENVLSELNNFLKFLMEAKDYFDKYFPLKS